MRLATVLLSLLLLAACGSDAAPVTTRAAQTPTTAAPTTMVGSAPTDTVVSATADCAPAPAPKPGTEARDAVCIARSADTPITAVLTQDTTGTGGPEPPAFRLELWSGGEMIADLSKMPPGAPLVGTPGKIVHTLAPLDFDGDGTQSLVVGVLAVGASTGPLDVAILSFRGVDVAVDFRESTRRDGELSVQGRDLILETGSYAAGDPGCCPSGILRQRIGWNPDVKRVEVLEQSVTPVTTTT